MERDCGHASMNHDPRTRRRQDLDLFLERCISKNHWRLLSCHAASWIDSRTSARMALRQYVTRSKARFNHKACRIPHWLSGIHRDKDTITLHAVSSKDCYPGFNCVCSGIAAIIYDLCMMLSIEFILRICSVLASFPRVNKDTAISESFWFDCHETWWSMIQPGSRIVHSGSWFKATGSLPTI